MSKPLQLNADGSYTATPGGMFRDLSAEEVKEFQAAAKEKHVHPFPEIRHGIWHPVYVAECQRIENESSADF